MTISPLSYYGRLLCRWLQSLGNVNTPRCLLSSCLRLCLFRLRFLDIWTSIRLASLWRWFFQTHAIGIWTSPLQGGARFLDYRHSTSSLLPPCECLPFLHARTDRRRLNAELHVHRSLHRTRILRLDSTCLRWSLSVCFRRRLTVDDFVCRCDFNITGESYRVAASGCLFFSFFYSYYYFYVLSFTFCNLLRYVIKINN